MISLNEFLVKGKYTKHTYQQFIDYCGDLSNTEIKILDEIDEQFKKYSDKYSWNDDIMSALYYLVVCAAMLVDDNLPVEKYSRLGYKNYPGNRQKNNPYNYSWFEIDDTNDDNISILDCVQEYIKFYTDEFDVIYKIVKRNKSKFSDIEYVACCGGDDENTLDNWYRIYNC